MTYEKIHLDINFTYVLEFSHYSLDYFTVAM